MTGKEVKMSCRADRQKLTEDKLVETEHKLYRTVKDLPRKSMQRLPVKDLKVQQIRDHL